MLVTTVTGLAMHLHSDRADVARIDPLIAALKGAGDFTVGGCMVCKIPCKDRILVRLWHD